MVCEALLAKCKGGVPTSDGGSCMYIALMFQELAVSEELAVQAMTT